jgi:hypothetical protein
MRTHDWKSVAGSAPIGTKNRFHRARTAKDRIKLTKIPVRMLTMLYNPFQIGNLSLVEEHSRKEEKRYRNPQGFRICDTQLITE